MRDVAKKGHERTSACAQGRIQQKLALISFDVFASFERRVCCQFYVSDAGNKLKNAGTCRVRIRTKA